MVYICKQLIRFINIIDKRKYEVNTMQMKGIHNYNTTNTFVTHNRV